MRPLLVVVLAAASTGCIVGPNYVKPSSPVTPGFKEPLPPYFKEAEGWKAGEPKDGYASAESGSLLEIRT